MPQPLSILNVFPTRAERLPSDPAFNPEWPPNKGWVDPNPKQAGRDMKGVPYATYYVYVGFDAATQQPVFDCVSLPFPLAKVTNIVPSGLGDTFGELLPDCPTPVRELENDELILPVGVAAIPMVFKASEIPQPSAASGFTGADRADLKAIKSKVGA